jgi:hypothetical protein
MPKKPAVPLRQSGTRFQFGRSVNIVLLISILVFLLTTGLAGGVFVYRKHLLNTIAAKDVELAEAKKSFEPDFVEEAARLSKRIEAIKSLLAAHITIAPLFEALEKKTLETVRFRDFSLDAKGLVPALTMTGEARSFNAVALQSDIFGSDRYFKNPVFSNFTLSELGNVQFSFHTSIDPALLLYSTTVLGAAASPDTTKEMQVE